MNAGDLLAITIVCSLTFWIGGLLLVAGMLDGIMWMTTTGIGAIASAWIAMSLAVIVYGISVALDARPKGGEYL